MLHITMVPTTFIDKNKEKKKIKNPLKNNIVVFYVRTLNQRDTGQKVKIRKEKKL